MPERASIPIGTVVTLKCRATALDRVEWYGAIETARTDEWSVAECPMTVAGQHEVKVVTASLGTDEGTLNLKGDNDPGSTVKVTTCIFDVVDIDPRDIKVKGVNVSVPAVNLDEKSSNKETMKHFFGESVAELRQIGEGHYVTSTHRTVAIKASVDPPAFASIIEWRYDDGRRHLGDPAERILDMVGTFKFSVGPPEASRDITIETYKTTITSHVGVRDFLRDGEVATFTAVTDPPGHEDYITWITSTKYGTGLPVMSQGRTFTAVFDNTWGPEGAPQCAWRQSRQRFVQPGSEVGVVRDVRA